MADPVGDPYLGERQHQAALRVRGGDHAILIAPQHERRDRAELAQAAIDAEAELLAAGKDQRPRLVPPPRLVGPHDGPRRERALASLRAVAYEPRDETGVTAPAASDQGAADEGGARHRARPEQGSPDERQAIELVDPVQRTTERHRSDQDEPPYELRPPKREMQRHPAAERMPEHERGRDREIGDDARNVIGEPLDG